MAVRCVIRPEKKATRDRTKRPRHVIGIAKEAGVTALSGPAFRDARCERDVRDRTKRPRHVSCDLRET